MNLFSKIFVKDKYFYKTIVKLAVPVILQSIIMIGLNMMDTLMLGVYGETQISGSSLASDFLQIYMILCFGIGGGAGVLTAQYWGAKDIKSLKQTVNIMLWICISLSLVFMTAAFVIPHKILAIYTPDTEIIQKGTLYLRMSAASFPLIGLTVCLTNVLRTIRAVKVPLIASTIAFVSNLFFNWIFIYGNLGAPEMQIEGAALATLITRVFETAVIAGYFFFVEKKIGYRIKDFFKRVPNELFSIYMRYGAPVIVSDAFMAFGNSAIAIITGHIGASYVAATAIVAQIMRLITVFNQGLSNSSGVITGNTLGQGDTEKAYLQGKSFLALGAILGGISAVILIFVAPYALLIFSITPETEAIAYQLIYAVAAIMIFQTSESIMTKGVLRAGGDTRFLMVADVLFLWIASIPLGYLAGIVLQLSPFVIYICLKIDLVIKAIWCITRLRSKKWIRTVSIETSQMSYKKASATK